MVAQKDKANNRQQKEPLNNTLRSCPQVLSENGRPSCVTLTLSPASRPKTSPQAFCPHLLAAPWCSEEPQVYSIVIPLSEALHGNCINDVELFWTKPLSLEMIILCDCTFPSNRLWHSKRRGGGGRGREGGLPRAASSMLLCLF